jgi:hypothetical protein
MPPQHAGWILAATCGVCSLALIYNTPVLKQAFLQLPSVAYPRAAAAAAAPATASGEAQNACASNKEAMGSLGAFHFEVTGKVSLLHGIVNHSPVTAVSSASTTAGNARVGRPSSQILARTCGLCVAFDMDSQVQGVYFRKFAVQKASALELVGWVANTMRGTVGEKQPLEGRLAAVEPAPAAALRSWDTSCNVGCR